MPAKKKPSTSIDLKPLDVYSAQAVVDCNICKRPLKMQLRIENDVIVEAGGLVEGCEYSKSCMATLCDMIVGMTAEDACAVDENDLASRIVKLNPKLGCHIWAVTSLKVALRNWRMQAAA